MRPASQKPSFGQDLVEAMKLITSHLRGEIELEQVGPGHVGRRAFTNEIAPTPGEDQGGRHDRH